jgi:hypothetical protein
MLEAVTYVNFPFTTGIIAYEVWFLWVDFHKISLSMVVYNVHNTLEFTFRMCKYEYFDKLNHEILFNKLYHNGIKGDMWVLLRNMYREMTTQDIMSIILWSSHSECASTSMSSAHVGAATLIVPRWLPRPLSVTVRSAEAHVQNI